MDKMAIKKLFFLFAFILLTGCSIFNRGSKTGIEAPAQMRGVVHHAYNVTRDCLISRGLPYNNTARNSRIIIEAVPGTRRVGGEWIMNYNGFDVGGLFFGSCRGRTFRIQIPVNPNTGGEWSMDVLRHEFGHAHDYGSECWGRHPPQLAPCYPRWRDIPGFFTHSENSNIISSLYVDDNGIMKSELQFTFDDGAVIYLSILSDPREPQILANINQINDDFFIQLRKDLNK